jgi:ribose/xylose/arabinose/galactoside ABC-type transport system permease subunit
MSVGVMFERYGTVGVVLVLFLAFGFTADRFFSQANLLNILQQVSIVAVAAIGGNMVILIGGIDLSPGSVILLFSSVTGALLQSGIFSVVPSILIGLITAGAVGLVNGIFIEKFKISPVIITLGTMIAVRGLAQILLALSGSWIWVTDPVLTFIGRGDILFIPVPVLFMAVFFIIAYLIMTHTFFGRSIYAIGGNEVAAKMCGLNTLFIKISVYITASIFSGLGGILMMARLGSISPAVGSGFEFDVITAVILGGTSLKGGVGRVEKTLLGAIIVGLTLNYLTMRGISAHYQRAVTGFIILFAALLDRFTHGKST